MRPQSSTFYCSVCTKPSALRCSRCLGAQYCSVDCQKKAWPTHKVTCKRAAEYRKQFSSGSVEEADVYFKFLKALASSGVAFAQNQLGNMYATGLGVEFDPAESFLWYKKAADAGDSDAEFRVGHSFMLGNGVPMNYYEAFKWLKKSIDSGNELALRPMVFDMKVLGFSVTMKGTLVGIVAQLCGSESANAEHVLGLMYYNGNGNAVHIDMNEAFFWFDLAVESDDKHFEAQFYLGRAYYFGEGTPMDKEEGLKKIKIAAEGGIPQAVSFLESLE